jgi:hypothetical protein
MGDSEEALLGIFSIAIGLNNFFGCWIYAIATYGWFLGLAFGWVPSGIIALIAMALSPLILIIAVVLILIILMQQ